MQTIRELLISRARDFGKDPENQRQLRDIIGWTTKGHKATSRFAQRTCLFETDWRQCDMTPAKDSRAVNVDSSVTNT